MLMQPSNAPDCCSCHPDPRPLRVATTDILLKQMWQAVRFLTIDIQTVRSLSRNLALNNKATYEFSGIFSTSNFNLHWRDTLDALKKNATFEGKFGTLNYQDEVWLSDRPVDMLQHVEVGWDVLEEARGFVGLQHLVHEVHVAEVVAGSALILDLDFQKLRRVQVLIWAQLKWKLATFLYGKLKLATLTDLQWGCDDVLHHLGPVVSLQRHYNLFQQSSTFTIIVPEQKTGLDMIF